MAMPHRTAPFFQLRDFCAGGAVERKRRVRAARNVGNDWRTSVRDADLIMIEDWKINMSILLSSELLQLPI